MIKNILFDFDGVIIDSMPIRDFGFKKIFQNYEGDQVDKLLHFHRENGGLSRYVKIRYFYNEILKKIITEDKVIEYSTMFSKIMRRELSNPKYLIKDTVEFIKNKHNDYKIHIVSGSDGEELRFLCEKLEISDFFISINGSPTPKDELVRSILEKYQYDIQETILIGDSKNDYEAAINNGINFYGYNNEKVKSLSKNYICKFSNCII